MMKWSLVACGLLLAALAPARAGELVVGPEVTITYSDPPGYCPVDPAGSDGEKQLYAAMQANFGADDKIRFLTLLVDCDARRAAQAGTLDSVVELRAIGWALELRDGQPAHNGDSRADYVAALTKVMQKILAKSPEQQAAAHLKDLLIEDSDPAVFAYGETVGNGDVEVDSAYAMTLIKGYGLMTVVLHTPADGSGLAPLVAQVRDLAHDVIALNDPEGAGSGEGGILGFFANPLVKGLLYLLIAVSVGLTYLRQRRKKKQVKADKG